MKKLVLLVALLCVAVSASQAQDVYQWFGGEPANSDWNYGMNWKCEIGPTAGTFGVVPDATAKTKHNNVLWGSIASVVIGGENGPQDIVVGDIFTVDAGWLSPEDVTVGVGGTLLVQGADGLLGTGDGQINVAYAALGVSNLIIDGGTADVDGPVHIGWGGTGSLILNSGSITVSAIDLGGAGGSGSIAITGGILNVRGWVEEEMWMLVDDGLMTGYGSPDNVMIAYDEDADITTVWAVPEPITVSLLGLGALLLRKRS